MRNAQSEFSSYFPWFAKDWLLSGARSRLSIPGRALYLDALFLCYLEGGLTSDKAELMLRLGIPEQYSADMDSVLKEFEIDPDSGRLTHPRIRAEVEKLASQRARQSAGGRARAAKTRQDS